jgi:hypothetical protein
MLFSNFCLMFRRPPYVVTRRTIAVPLLRPLEGDCCRHARFDRSTLRRETGGKTAGRMRSDNRERACARKLLVEIARFVQILLYLMEVFEFDAMYRRYSASIGAGKDAQGCGAGVFCRCLQDVATGSPVSSCRMASLRGGER